ncbi:HAD family hydrolase [Clostridium akagii]|uniref:HAD family hydrolase n=1 Tax=Clostridium akagii TaxID=91623 RepID=UPI0004798F16|nr:HAD hydrolase-like protein [Clostridium akagii]
MINQDKNKLIFFDIGGTLIGSPNLFNFIASKYNENNTEEIKDLIIKKYENLYGNKDEKQFLSVKEILELILKEISEEEGLKDLSDFAHDYYEQFYSKKAYLYDDVIYSLNELKRRGIKLIVFSDSDSDILIGELKRLDIYEYFDDFIISGDIGAYKPADKIINKALEYFNKELNAIYMVGNSDMDILSAEKMKAKSVIINRNNKKINYKCDYTISSLMELLTII